MSLVTSEEVQQPEESPAKWISVYNPHFPMKQRYHCNLSDSRLNHHIEKGFSDGLYISCVASAENLWTLIMDGRTGFSSQVYEFSNVFLPEDWIVEQWEKGYQITSIAGADNGSSFVVMSKGTSYSEQSFKVHDDFPSNWIETKWNEGFHVTSMGTAGSRWGVVMSKNSNYSHQVLEIDNLYPSERIQRRWETGYKITSMAATENQAAFILSTPSHFKPGEVQETLQTSAFPSNHIKEKWSKDIYISLICYGGTV